MKTAALALAMTAALAAFADDGVLFYGEQDAKASSQTADKGEVVRDVHPHDLVTVRIRDVFSFLNNTQLTTDNKYDTNFAINKFFNITEGAGGSGQVARPTAGDKPSIDVTSELKGDKSGKVVGKQTMEAVITGHVVEVYPNHTFSFEATTTTEKDENKMSMTLFGVARVQDISEANVVLGERLDNKQFSVKSEGSTARMAERGWFVRLLDFVWPF